MIFFINIKIENFIFKLILKIKFFISIKMKKFIISVFKSSLP